MWFINQSKNVSETVRTLWTYILSDHCYCTFCETYSSCRRTSGLMLIWLNWGNRPTPFLSSRLSWRDQPIQFSVNATFGEHAIWQLCFWLLDCFCLRMSNYIYESWEHCFWCLKLMMRKNVCGSSQKFVFRYVQIPVSKSSRLFSQPIIPSWILL